MEIYDTDELESRSAVTPHAAQMHAQWEGEAAAEHLAAVQTRVPADILTSPEAATTTDEDHSSDSDIDSNSDSNNPRKSNSHQQQASLLPSQRQLTAPLIRRFSASRCELRVDELREASQRL